MEKKKNSIEYELRNSKKYQCQGKYNEKPLNALWTETMVSDESKEIGYKIIYEVED